MCLQIDILYLKIKWKEVYIFFWNSDLLHSSAKNSAGKAELAWQVSLKFHERAKFQNKKIILDHSSLIFLSQIC